MCSRSCIKKMDAIAEAADCSSRAMRSTHRTAQSAVSFTAVIAARGRLPWVQSSLSLAFRREPLIRRAQCAVGHPRRRRVVVYLLLSRAGRWALGCCLTDCDGDRKTLSSYPSSLHYHVGARRCMARIQRALLAVGTGTAAAGDIAVGHAIHAFTIVLAGFGRAAARLGSHDRRRQYRRRDTSHDHTRSLWRRVGDMPAGARLGLFGARWCYW